MTNLEKAQYKSQVKRINERMRVIKNKLGPNSKLLSEYKSRIHASGLLTKSGNLSSKYISGVSDTLLNDLENLRQWKDVREAIKQQEPSLKENEVLKRAQFQDKISRRADNFFSIFNSEKEDELLEEINDFLPELLEEDLIDLDEYEEYMGTIDEYQEIINKTRESHKSYEDLEEITDNYSNIREKLKRIMRKLYE